MVTREFLESRWAIGRAGRINDSKLLTAEQREELYAEIEQLAGQGLIHAHVGAAGVLEIEQRNILGATKLAMHRALEAMPDDSRVEVDGRQLRRIDPDVLEVIHNFREAAALRGIDYRLVGVPETAAGGGAHLPPRRS